MLTLNEKIASLREKPLPRHVAIIMDGNRRWTLKNKLSEFKNVLDGHFAGADALVNIVSSAKEMGIKVLTVFGFSTENKSRSRAEIETLFHIVELYLKNNL